MATGIALENGLVITTSLVTRHPFERISVETIKGETIAARIAGQDPRSGLTLLRLDKKGLRPMPQARQAEVGNWVALVGLFYDRFPAIFQGIISSLSENELILNAPVAPGSAGGAVVNKNGELLGIIRGSIGFSSSPDFTFKDHSAAIVVSGSKNRKRQPLLRHPRRAGPAHRRQAERRRARSFRAGWGSRSAATPTRCRKYQGFAGGEGRDRQRRPDRGDLRQADRLVPRHRRRAPIPPRRGKGQRHGQPGGQAAAPGRGTGRAPRPGAAAPFVEESRLRKPAVPRPPASGVYEKDLPQLAEQLAEMPELPELATALPRVRNYVIEFGGARQLGVDVMEITADLGRKFAVKEGYGLLVSRVNEGTAADKAGLKAGDIIVRAKGSAMRSASDLRTSSTRLKEKEAVLIELYRDGRLRKFSLLPDRTKKWSGTSGTSRQKVENLKENISDEARMIYQDEIRKMQLSKEKALAGLQKQKEQSLLKLRDQSKKMAAGAEEAPGGKGQAGRRSPEKIRRGIEKDPGRARPDPGKD